MTSFYQYDRGTNPIAASGHMRAFGRRLLVKAIMQSDSYQGPLQIVTYNATEAVCFDIISVGKGVKRACEEMGEDVPEVGMHCDIRSVAADRVNAKDPTGRYWLVDVADVAGVWAPVSLDDPALLAELAKGARVDADPYPLTGINNRHLYGEAVLEPVGG